MKLSKCGVVEAHSRRSEQWRRRIYEVTDKVISQSRAVVTALIPACPLFVRASSIPRHLIESYLPGSPSNAEPDWIAVFIGI